jgi:hypothetical protein
MSCNLLVARRDEARLPVTGACVEERDVRVAADAEDLLDASIGQELDDVIGDGRNA